MLNTTLFSNTPGGAVVAGRRATLTIDGQFYAPAASRSPPVRAGRCCAGKSRAIVTTSCSGRRSILHGASDRGQDSPLRPLSRVLQNLQVMDEVRRRWARCLTKNVKEPAGHWFADSASVSAIARQRTRTMPDVCCPAALRLHGPGISMQPFDIKSD
nr:Uncharacterised protein [Klebsiella pneumoniae]